MPISLGIRRDTLILLLSLLVVVTGCSEKHFQQRSSAMSPTIESNESILAEMSAYKKSGPKRWDVVVFHPPPKETSSRPGDIWVMRVIGLPGESLEIRDDGVYIDGNREAQPDRLSGVRYAFGVSVLPSSTVTYPYKIPAEKYFLVGDNTTNSFDSRFWGALPRQSILGRVKNR